MTEEQQRDIVIVSAVRTPFSRFDSAMADIPSIDLGVMVMKEVIGRVGVKPEEVDEIYYGSCIPAEVALEMDVPARQASLLAGFPDECISLTLDRACCSSLTTLRLGTVAIAAGAAATVLSVGSENMPRTPHLAPGLRRGVRLGPITLIDNLFELGYTCKGVQSRRRRCGGGGPRARSDPRDAGRLGPEKPGSLPEGLLRRQAQDRRGADARRHPPEKRRPPLSSKRTSRPGRRASRPWRN